MPWRELKLLEACSTVTLRSYLDNDKLHWKATVKPYDTSKAQIVTDAPEIQDAVRQAVEIAKAAGVISDEPTTR